MSTLSDHKSILVTCLVVIYVTIMMIWSSDHILFWDTVQFAGKVPHWFIENGGIGMLPVEYDSGHPPLFSIYIYSAWLLFGKSLAVTHWVMWPFLVANGILLWNLAKSIDSSSAGIWLLIYMTCPFYLGHSILVSPDIVLFTGFLAVCLSYFKNNVFLRIIGLVILALISMRGQMIVLSILAADIVLHRKISRSFLRTFVIPVVLIVGFQLYHLYKSRWVGFHDESPWSDSFTLVTVLGFIKNNIVFVWRIIDFGMIIPALILVIHIKKIFQFRLRYILLFVLLVFYVVIIPFSGLLNHRYFLPIVFLILFYNQYVLKDKSNYWRGAVLISMIVGNLLVYPPHISQGWDSTAAHWPFYQLESQLNQAVADQGYRNEQIGTAFPLRTERHHLYINSHDTNSYGYHTYDINTDSLLIYSNIMNEYSDEEIELILNWDTLYISQQRGIDMILLKK